MHNENAEEGQYPEPSKAMGYTKKHNKFVIC
jgi:hypothetical protein